MIKILHASLHFPLLLSHHSLSSQFPHQAAHNHCSPVPCFPFGPPSLSLSTPIKSACTVIYFSTALHTVPSRSSFSSPSAQLGVSTEAPSPPSGRSLGAARVWAGELSWAGAAPLLPAGPARAAPSRARPRTHPAVPVRLHGAVHRQHGPAAVQPEAGGLDVNSCGESAGSVTGRGPHASSGPFPWLTTPSSTPTPPPSLPAPSRCPSQPGPVLPARNIPVTQQPARPGFSAAALPLPPPAAPPGLAGAGTRKGRGPGGVALDGAWLMLWAR